jgi:glyceraldehyde 3-phosphate dehydrogenase
VVFNKYKIQVANDSFIILEPNGNKHIIEYTNHKQRSIPWIGRPNIVFECSGKFTIAKNCDIYIYENTKLVIISATSWDVQKTLIYGFNHEEYNKDLNIISYGSCTVNAYVPFANYMNNKYNIIDSDVNVIHNIQEYRLKNNLTLTRKFCTLEKSAQLLLPFIKDDNFIVNYTVIPYPGVSIIDFRFRIEKPIGKVELVRDLRRGFDGGGLADLYGLDKIDLGPEIYNCSTFSTVFIEDTIKVLRDNIYLQGYFDNENSANRFFDLINYISQRKDVWETK